jgi:hypothetical protein
VPNLSQYQSRKVPVSFSFRICLARPASFTVVSSKKRHIPAVPFSRPTTASVGLSIQSYKTQYPPSIVADGTDVPVLCLCHILLELNHPRLQSSAEQTAEQTLFVPPSITVIFHLLGKAALHRLDSVQVLRTPCEAVGLTVRRGVT